MVLDFPNTRLSSDIAGNPLFSSDIVNATQSIQAAMQSLSDLRSTDFAIISGFDYSSGTYTSGIVWLGDGFYFLSGTLTEGYYLTPNVTNVENKIFSDSVVRPTYSINYCVQSATPYGSNPIFSGDMSQHRMNLKSKLSSSDVIDSLLSTLVTKPLSANQGRILKSTIDNLTNSKLSVSNNLSDLNSVSTAQTNLQVYSKTTIDAKLKGTDNWHIIGNIGEIPFSANHSQSVAHPNQKLCYRLESNGDLLIRGWFLSVSGGSGGTVFILPVSDSHYPNVHDNYQGIAQTSALFFTYLSLFAASGSSYTTYISWEAGASLSSNTEIFIEIRVLAQYMP